MSLCCLCRRQLLRQPTSTRSLVQIPSRQRHLLRTAPTPVFSHTLGLSGIGTRVYSSASSSAPPIPSSAEYTHDGSTFTTSSASSAPTDPTAPATPSQDGTEQLRLSLLDAALKHVPTHGWTDQALLAAVRETAYSPAILSIFQPEPAWCLVAHFLSQSTRAAFTSYHQQPLDRVNKQQRVTRLLGLLLAAHTPYLSRLSQLLGLCFAPSLASRSLPLLADLTDECLYVVQDTSTGTDWYGRRLAFASVWLGGLLHRSVDRSEGGRDTQQWVERRMGEWVQGEEVLGEVGVKTNLYAHMGYNALLNMLAGKQ